LNRSLEKLASDSKDGEIIDFAVSTMSLIYSEPQEQAKTTHFHLWGGNKLANVGTELNQTLGDMNQSLATAIAKGTKATTD